MMKSLRFALVTFSLALSSTGALAQMGSDSDKFLEAVQSRDGDQAIQLLQDHPTIINAKNSKGDTALIIVIDRTDADWTGYLLNHGADPNAPGAGGDTPLIAAARMGFDEAAEWLIGLHAKVDGTNKMGETPLIIAVQKRDAPLVKLLLAAGADADVRDTAAGYSARDYAKRDSRSREILKLIEDKKPSPSAAAAN